MISACIAFLREIGLPVDCRPSVGKSFVTGVRIDQGSLQVEPSCRASNLLHEAGHLAITPGRWRMLMSDDLSVGIGRMLSEWHDIGLDPDDPLSRAVMQVSDPEATAWAWAAGLHLGLPTTTIIMDDEYDGTGDDIRMMLEMCKPTKWGRVTGYVGVHGLAHAGMTALHDRGPLPMYPQMSNWLQIH